MNNNLFLTVSDDKAESLQGGGPGPITNGDGFSFFFKSTSGGFKTGLWTSAFSFFAKFSFGGKMDPSYPA